MSRRRVTVLVSLAAALTVSCGKKGDPLPPLNRMPVAPDGFVAERRADGVELTFVVPATNTDGTRPANIERVDVYALTGPGTLTDNELIQRGTRIATLDVKSPRNPNDVVDADDNEEIELVGTGLDQGVTAHVRESLAGQLASTGADPGASRRQYVGVGITTRGRRALFSKRATVSLLPAPAPPAKPDVAYDQKQITLTWQTAPGLTYHVYEMVTLPQAAETRLTPTPVTTATFADPRIEWGVERCYTIRSIEDREGALTESLSSPSSCVTLTDRFAPAPPAGLTAVASDGAVSLTWDANPEADLAGYVVLRGPSADALTPVSADTITETSFRDTVSSGGRFFYAVQAVDKSGNKSDPSSQVDATAR